MKCQLLNKGWAEFMKQVRNETSHGLDERLKVIAVAQLLFKKTNHFYELENDERKFIAGLPNKLDKKLNLDSGYFGSMKGAGIFMKRFNWK